MFLKPFIYPEKISLGVECCSDEIRFALVYTEKNGKSFLIKSGNRIPEWLRILLPLYAHSSLSHTPAIITVKDTGQEDPDTWIENQEGLKNPNTDDKNLISEYFVDKTTVYKIQTSTDARNTLYRQLQSCVDLYTLRPPLWDLAILYWEARKKPFVVWKITKDGSVIGFVDNGYLQKICHFWPDTDELWDNPEKTVNEAMPLIQSMTQQKNVPVILFSPQNCTVESLQGRNLKIQFDEPPAIKGVAVPDHEVYALAINHTETLNFVPFDKIQKSKKIKSIWNGSVCAVRWFTIITLGALLFLWGTGEGLTLYEKVNHERFSGIAEQIDNLKKTNGKRDSVLTVFKEKARFLAEESATTALLNDFQDVFPEGMYAEEITVTDSENKKYRIDIRAIASSSSLIGVCMEKLQNVKGVTGCRMVYSEQIATKTVNGIRVKIEAEWR